MKMEKGFVKVSLSGRDLTLRIPLKLALAIESETGKGVVELVQLGVKGSLPLRDVSLIIKAALAENGEHWDSDEVFAAIEDMGIMKAMLLAANILNVFFETPKSGVSTKKAKAPDATISTSH